MIRETKAGAHRLLSDLLQEGKGWILLTVGVGWFFSIGVRFAYPTLLPFFQESFGISLSVASLLVTLLWIAYAVGQFPGGVLGDRFGEGNILVTSTLLSLIGITVVAFASTVYALAAGTIAFGLATALYGPTRYTIFTDIYSERSGVAVGITMAAGSVGNTVVPVLAALVASYASWRFGFAALVPVFMILAFAIWFFVPSRTSSPINDSESVTLETIRQVIEATRSGGIPILVTVHTVAGFVSQGFLALYPTYLVTVKGFSPSVAATIYSLYFAVGVAVQPMTGTIRDRIGPRLTLMTVLGIYAVCLLLLPLTNGLLMIGLLTVFLSSRNGAGVVTNTFISMSLPSEIKGSGLGLLRTVWILIGATSPVIVGSFGDAGYLEEAFLVLALLATTATVLSLFIPDQ